MSERIAVDMVEFYLPGSLRPFFRIESAFQPNAEDLINIKGETWRVIARSFTVDYADDWRQRYMRCNLIVEKQLPPKPKKKRAAKTVDEVQA